MSLTALTGHCPTLRNAAVAARLAAINPRHIDPRRSIRNEIENTETACLNDTLIHLSKTAI
jgi:hypothetical protein